jgi:hypothetical protein
MFPESVVISSQLVLTISLVYVLFVICVLWCVFCLFAFLLLCNTKRATRDWILLFGLQQPLLYEWMMDCG